jgi:hypothetical protein
MLTTTISLRRFSRSGRSLGIVGLPELLPNDLHAVALEGGDVQIAARAACP